MRHSFWIASALGLSLGLAASAGEAPPPLGLPPVPIPADNLQSAAKIDLGEDLFNDKRFSSTGEVSCASCHAPLSAMTDSPLKTSEGIHGLTGTRNAPTVVNSAYMESMFHDGRSPDLEDQALHPFTNPVEMGLADHEPILAIVRKDRAYRRAFRAVFGTKPKDITMTEVTAAIASFERTQVSGNSAFDRWYYGDEPKALNASEQRGFDLFVGQGRCVSCHLIEETQALFTDNRFHNIGVGINDIQDSVSALALAFLEADIAAEEVDVKVLTDARASELGRFAVTRAVDAMGAIKTPTLRNIAVTSPYMHDGSIATLRDVIVHYNNGGVTKEGDPVNDFLSGGIRPLNLSDDQITDLVAFMEALTSPRFAEQSAQSGL